MKVLISWNEVGAVIRKQTPIDIGGDMHVDVLQLIDDLRALAAPTPQAARLIGDAPIHPEGCECDECRLDWSNIGQKPGLASVTDIGGGDYRGDVPPCTHCGSTRWTQAVEGDVNARFCADCGRHYRTGVTIDVYTGKTGGGLGPQDPSGIQYGIGLTAAQQDAQPRNIVSERYVDAPSDTD